MNPVELNVGSPSIRCPRCACDGSALPTDARFCPHCGHPWPALVHALDQPAPQSPPPVIDPPPLPHSLIIQAYACALAHLGQRYQLGHGVQRNPDEALRCYLKAARLGNDPARSHLARLGIPQDSP